MSNQIVAEKTEKSAETNNKAGNESMVVKLSRLDKMLDLAGEVIIVSSNLSTISQRLLEGSKVSRELSEDTRDLAITSSRISSDLHSLVSDVRTVDMRDLFARFRRLARDTSRRLGKAVRFEVEGEDICIDKKISEKIYDPVAHQIRNSMSHGIEDEETRVRLGKDPVGNVAVRIRHLENSTVIDVIDDGRGIDDDAIRNKVVEMGLAEEKNAALISGDALYEYLYMPGFSTAEQASATSGRGVGLDVVQTVMNEINGETKIKSERGKGTTFSFILPVVTAVNIADSLMIRAGNSYFAFPILSVVTTMLISETDVTITTGKARSIKYLGKLLPLFNLLEIFGEEPVLTDDGKLPVLIVEHKHKLAAFVVSDFLSPQKIVITEFDENMKIPGLSGTAILSGRQMGLVIDLPELFEVTFGSGNRLDICSAAPEIVVAGEEEFFEDQTPPDTEESPAKPPAGADYDSEQSDNIEVDQPDSEFLHEVQSMLSELNRDLLTLEENVSVEVADAVFRLAHSIKGNLTMYGAEGPASMTHQLETILAQARQGELQLEGDAFDVLFDGCSYLEEVVKALLEGDKPQPPPEKLITGIKPFVQIAESKTDQAKQIDINSVQVVLDPRGEFYLSSRRRDGATMYQCRIEFDHGDQPRFLVAYLILRRLQRVADVLGTLPTMADIESGICDNGIVVVFCPREPREGLIDELGESLKRHYGVSRFDATTYA
jgi:chemotaxis protein histidine kinase CheA